MVVVCGLSPTSAQGSQIAAADPLPSPPATCYARPADDPQLRGVGLFWWDAPECAAARKRWNDSNLRPAAAGPGAQTATSLALASSLPSNPAVEVDSQGVTFVTDGLAQPPQHLKFTWLPKGTLFPVHTMRSYSTDEVRAADRIRFELDSDVVANGYLIAMKGDTAEGSFPKVIGERGSFGMGTNIVNISVDTVYSYCGDTINVNFDRTEYRRKRSGPLSGLLAPRGHQDADGHFIRGRQYVAFTVRPQRVCGVPTLKAQTAIPAGALFPTTQ